MTNAMNGIQGSRLPRLVGSILIVLLIAIADRGMAAEGDPPPEGDPVEVGDPEAGTSSGPVSTNLLTVLVRVRVPDSKFVTEPTYGLDPFFPTSKRRIEPDRTVEPDPEPEPEPKREKNRMVNELNPGKISSVLASTDTDFLSIKGILATARSRNVTLHTTLRSYLFRSGDEILLRVPDGKVRVRCIEIRDRSAVFKIEGRPEPVELFLRN